MQIRRCFVYLGIYTGTLSCIVKLPDEVCASHTKRVGKNKSFLQLKKFAEVLLTGYPFKINLYIIFSNFTFLASFPCSSVFAND